MFKYKKVMGFIMFSFLVILNIYALDFSESHAKYVTDGEGSVILPIAAAGEHTYDLYAPANANYTAHGKWFVFNGAAMIDLGSLLTAIISFLVVALVLFIIVKVTDCCFSPSKSSHQNAAKL